MKLISLALLACLVPLAPPALADTVFNLSGRLETDKANDHSGAFDHDALLSGTLTLNSAGTAFDAVNLTYDFQYGTDHPASIPIAFNAVIATQSPQSGITRVRILGTSRSFDFAQNLDIPTADLSTYAGGALCGTDYASDCGGSFQSLGSIFLASSGQSYGYSNIESARLSLANPLPTPPPAAATPEPASMVLLGTGLLGTAGVLRRRTVG